MDSMENFQVSTDKRTSWLLSRSTIAIHVRHRIEETYIGFSARLDYQNFEQLHFLFSTLKRKLG